MLVGSQLGFLTMLCSFALFIIILLFIVEHNSKRTGKVAFLRLCSHLVLGHVHGHKMVLCSDTGYPICWCPVQCPSTRSRPCTRARAPCPNFGVGIWKKGVFTLVPVLNRSRGPCSGTKSERSLINSAAAAAAAAAIAPATATASSTTFRDKIRNLPWTCCLLAFYIVTPGPVFFLSELFPNTVCSFLSRISYLSSYDSVA